MDLLLVGSAHKGGSRLNLEYQASAAAQREESTTLDSEEIAGLCELARTTLYAKHSLRRPQRTHNHPAT